MTIWRLVIKEIVHRKLSFVLAVISVAAAACVLVAATGLLRVHDLQTEAILEAKIKEAEARLAVLEDDYRKYMKELGFNLLILPARQRLSEFWEKGYATHTMPEENVNVLADSGTQSMRHLLPLVQQKVFWPEQKRRIILIGTCGEVPIRHRRPAEPMLLAVPPGRAVVGYEIAQDLELSPGDKITLIGREFLVDSCRPERGAAEDITIWIDLPTAQNLLAMEGRINAIEALKCHCAGRSFAELRKEVGDLLPDTKVILRENKVTVRAKARRRARQEHQAAISAEKANRAQLRRQREDLAAVLVPLVILGSAVWVALLALINVRQRRAEIGILRAIGLSGRQVFIVFIARAVLAGLIGAIIGCLLGYGCALSVQLASYDGPAELSLKLVSPALLAAVLVCAPLLAAWASWIPAMIASRQDPAIVLQQQ